MNRINPFSGRSRTIQEQDTRFHNTCLENTHRWKNGSGSHDIACKKCRGYPWITVRYKCEKCFEERCIIPVSFFPFYIHQSFFF